MRQGALDAERAGDLAQAAVRFRAATDANPRDAALLNSAGSFHARHSEHEQALAYFDAALRLRADFGEVAVNRAIALAALDRAKEALASLQASEPKLGNDARYWSTRGGLERKSGDLQAAAKSYDACLACDAGHMRGRRARARLALERGEADAVPRLEQAIAAAPGDAELWLELAQALDAAGRAGEARAMAETLVTQAPHWTDALELLAQLRWAAGELTDFCDHYPTALAKGGYHPVVIRSWIAMLAAVDRHAAAAAVASEARGRDRNAAVLALLEAAHAGTAGDDARAEAIFEALDLATPERWLAEARHRLRRHEAEAAERLTERVLASDPANVVAWALRDIAWRLAGDRRHEWLHGQTGLIATLPFAWSAHRDEIVALLQRIHQDSAPPLGQSVRAGTQTRGGLFDRTEPALIGLRTALKDALEQYRAGLPSHDDSHPLLRHRDTNWRISGSWSVRLTGAGHHIAHIHPAGMISSAAYLVVPPPSLTASDEAALELGIAPKDLRLTLPPLATVQPAPGLLALFPSTLYHGTRPFSRGERMTAAFDVTPG